MSERILKSRAKARDFGERHHQERVGITPTLLSIINKYPYKSIVNRYD